MKTTYGPSDPSRSSGSPNLATLLLLAVVAVGTLLSAARPAEAQYFGRNKVQYDDFDFRVLETEHFRIHYYRDEEEAVRDAARMAERWYERFARTFQHAFRQKKPIIFYANQADFQQTNAIPGFISQATGGVTEGIKNRVIMPFAESYGETSHVLGHELIHAFQYDIAQARRGGGSTGFQQLPLWAVEGLAEYLSVGRQSPHTAMWMRDAVLRDDLPTIRQLSTGREYFPYRFGHALWAYIGGRFGDPAVPRFYRGAANGGLQAASREILGVPIDTLSSQWRRDTREYFAGAMEDRLDPNEVGSLIVPREEDGGLTVSPSVSPDGDRVVYLGQRDVFTVDLYVADTRTGEVLGRLATANANPHLDQLAYMNTSGAWSPDASRFAFATYAGGDNEIAVASVEDRSIQRRFRLEGVGGVYSMDWSPDGRHVVFAGTTAGVTDLYQLDVEDGSVERLTDDEWTQLHPSFSPDGSRIVFSTDEGEPGDLQNLMFPETGIGFLDRETGRREVFRPFDNAKHIDPKFSPDGSSLYFVSDRDGFSDIYRMSLPDRTIRRVTRVTTGVSGITALSPALTVAREGGEVLFTVFRDGRYAVRRLSAQQSQGEPLRPVARRAIGAGMLPPRELTEPIWVASYLRNPAGLPDPASFQDQDYGAGLSLDYVAQPTAGVAVDRFGTSLGGAVAAYFSDMLGDRQLGVALQANGQIQDIGGQVAYTNRRNRWNWSLQGGRIPFRQARFARGTTTRNGEEVFTQDLIIERTIINRASAGVSYPFSTTRRFEADAGATLFTFDREAIRTFISPGGVPLGRDEIGLEAPESLLMYTTSAALVEDRSFFGFTSPVRGARARLEVGGNFGDLSFANVLADYRRYFFFNPVTLAFRGFHFGRYGGDAESGRLTPLYLGFERYVRGYHAQSFDAGECTPVPGEPQACPELDRLVGSRMAVGNVEFRIPLIGTDQLGLLPLGFVPTEVSLFTDAGVAWTSNDAPELELSRSSTARIPVFSSGVSVRFNVLGRLVFETYWAYPFQRPGRGGVWGFQLAPGF